MIDSDFVADLFGFSGKKNVNCWHTISTVVSVENDGYSVRLSPGSTTKAAKFCQASVGDRVLVLVLNGIAYAIARKVG